MTETLVPFRSVAPEDGVSITTPTAWPSQPDSSHWCNFTAHSSVQALKPLSIQGSTACSGPSESRFSHARSPYTGCGPKREICLVTDIPAASWFRRP